jgi:hypothetical protein
MLLQELFAEKKLLLQASAEAAQCQAVLNALNARQRAAQFTTEEFTGELPVRRSVLHLSGIHCEPEPDCNSLEMASARAKVNTANVELNQLQRQINDATIVLDELVTERGALADFLYVVLRKLLPKHDAGSGMTDRRRLFSDAVDECLTSATGDSNDHATVGALPFLEQLRGSSELNDTTVFAALAKSFLDKATHATDGRHVRFPPAVLHAALCITHTSPAAYLKLRSIIPSLPCPRHLRNLNATGDSEEGVCVETIKKVQNIVSSFGPTLDPRSLHGTLLYDGMSVLQVCGL